MNLYFNNNIISVITEMPKEPKKLADLDSLTYNEAAWQVYKERLQKAKLSAIPLKNQEDGRRVINALPEVGLFSCCPGDHAFDSTCSLNGRFFSIEGHGYKIEPEWKLKDYTCQSKVAVLIPLSEKQEVKPIEQLIADYINDSEWGYPQDGTGKWMFNLLEKHITAFVKILESKKPKPVLEQEELDLEYFAKDQDLHKDFLIHEYAGFMNRLLSEFSITRKPSV